MIASHAKAALLTASVLSPLLLMGTLFPALAQDAPLVPALAQDAPLVLQPPTSLEPTQPRVSQPIRPIRPEVSVPQSIAPRVDVNALRGVDPDSVGVLSVENGGFSAALWQNTSRPVLEALLARLPVDNVSLVRRSLMRRLLLSAAEVPVEGGSGPGSLIEARARQLSAMGDVNGLNDLITAAPHDGQRSSALERLQMNARFLSGDNARACTQAMDLMEQSDGDDLQKAMIFCQALAGEHDRAALGVSMMQEMGTEDATFFALVDALSQGKPAPLESLNQPTPLSLAMARATRSALPLDVIEGGNLAVLRTVSISPNAPVELRLEAAERAESAGVLPTDSLRQLYASMEFTDEERASPLTTARTNNVPRTRALLYRTALTQTVPVAQAETIHRSLEMAREIGRYTSGVRTFQPVLARLAATSELAWFAPEAIRAHLSLRDPDSARPWFALLENAARHDASLETARQGLAPLMRLTGFMEAEAGPAALDDWWVSVQDDEGAAARAALLYTVLEALGEPVPPSTWEGLLRFTASSEGVRPDPAVWVRIKTAAQEGRLGETVMLSLILLGDTPPAAVDPVVLQRVIIALRAVGLEVEARALAVEAVVASGL